MSAESSSSKTDSRGHFSFRPRARLMHTVGDDLISDESVAILELVKNAYDADAKNVLIVFAAPLETGKGSIAIIDNGNGMPLDTVLGDWVQPATDAKRRKRYSLAGRRVLGEKGIGRFAAARLADELELTTRAGEDSLEVRALVDWNEFDRKEFLDEVIFLWERGPAVEICPGGTIDKVWDETTPDTEKNHGTILRLTGLRTSWDRENLTRLRAVLARLISPFEQAIDFTVKLQLPEEFRDLSGDVGAPAVLEHPDYIIRGKVGIDGSYKLEYEHAGEKQPVEGQYKFRPKHRLSASGPFEVELRVWDRERSSLEQLATQIELNYENIRKDLDEAAGISIYRDGFRVLPYGEPQNDWLRLDMRRVQSPVMRVSNNQVVGYIRITSDDNMGLKDQTNREGIQQGPALRDLASLTRAVVAELEKKRYIARQQQRNTSPTPLKNRPHTQDMFEGMGLSSIRELIRERYPNDRELQMAMERQDRFITERIGLVKQTLARYSRLATLGQIVDIVLHDGRTYIAQIGNEADLGRRFGTKLETQLTAVNSLIERFQKIGGFADSLGQLFRRIEPFGGRTRGRPENVAVEKVIGNVISIFRTELDQLGVEVSTPSTQTPLRMVQGEVQQIFVNLLQNSLYWLQQESQGPRRIAYSVSQSNEGAIEVLFCDSGPGVPVDLRERIFDPYFSAKPDGVGLGLTIAGETAAEYDGRLELVNRGLLPGACFLITLHPRGT